MGTKFKGIKTAAEYRQGQLARDILKLVGAGVVVGATVIAPNTAQLIDYFDPKGRTERNRLWKCVKYLERKHRIQIEERGGEKYVFLTAAGRTKLDEDAVWDLAVNKPRAWDRKWRLVMFDFPSHIPTRHSFRGKLEDLGFIQYQRSVFIYPYECHEEIHTIARWYGLDEYVRYVVATEVHDMRRFAKLFDLL